jgi:starch phosphorylase
MAYLAIRGSAVNGVSRLHGEVSRTLFQSLFPRWPSDEVPVGHVTNGVHMPSWDSSEADALWTRACGADGWLGTATTDRTEQMRRVPDADIWTLRSNARTNLVRYSRRRLARQLALSGCSVAEIDQAARILDPKALTLGFARRFATYKRPTLLLHDPSDWCILTNPIVRYNFSLRVGRSSGNKRQAMIRQWTDFIRRRPSAAACSLSVIQHKLTGQLVHGVDVWVNNPRRRGGMWYRE